MLVRARAPLRISLAGGGTDVSPYCDTYGGCVLNATINKYAYALLDLAPASTITFEATDLGVQRTYALDAQIDAPSGLELHAAVYNYVIENFLDNKRLPLKLSTFCEAPIGSGLGSSSTIAVAILKAFDEMLSLSLDDYKIASLAFHIEREICGFHGGRQDQYAAAFGGVNFIEFHADNKALVNPLRIKNWILCELEASLVLFFTGISRQSAGIIKDNVHSVCKGNDVVLQAMHALKEEASLAKESLLRGDFEGLCKSLERGWENKKKCSSKISNPYIDAIYNGALGAGARVGRISGAGGGGFMIFFVPPENRMRVKASLNKQEGEIMSCHFSKIGAQAWRIGG